MNALPAVFGFGDIFECMHVFEYEYVVGHLKRSFINAEGEAGIKQIKSFLSFE